MIVTMNRCFAQELYKHEDSSGHIIYSSKPASPDATPVSLPTIGHKDITITQDKTCSTHGGNGCSLGPDVDGSVICEDGFRDAMTRFNFVCRMTKLSLVNKVVSDDGILRLIIRNMGAAKAKGIVVYYNTHIEVEGSQEKLIASGPENIEGFQSGDYLLNIPNLLDLTRENIVDKVEITCENCG